MNNYPLRPSGSISRYPFLVLLPSFALGILLQQYLNRITPFAWAISSILFVAASLPLVVAKSIRPHFIKLRTWIIIIAFLMLGAMSASIADIRNDRQWYGHFLTETQALKVAINEEPVTKSKTVLLPVDVQAVYRSGKWMKVCGTARLYVYRKNLSINYRPGQVLIIPNTLVPVKGSGNPFAFDVGRQAERNGIFHQTFLSQQEMCLLSSKEQSSSGIVKLKKSLQIAIDKNVKDSTTRALIAATLLNERSDMSEELMAAYSNTGIVHIIAISGMHIVLLAACILWLLKFIPSQKLNALKYGVAVIIVWLYIGLTGFPPSAVRAAVMFTLAAIGICLNRLGNPVNVWGAAGLLVLSYNPYWLYDVGIQLSFLAVLSILLFYTPIKNWLSPSGRAGRWLWEVVAVSIAAQILVFPLVIYYFHQFPLLGIAANIPAALYSTLLMFGAMLMFLLYAAVWLGNLLTVITKAFNAIIVFLSDCTPELMRSLQIDAFEYWLFMLILVFLCLCCMYRKGIYLLPALALCILFTIDLTVNDYTALHQCRLIVYNTNKSSQADLIMGKKVCHLYALDSTQLKYTLGPAMLGYGINTETTKKAETNTLISVNRASILFLGKCVIDTSKRFPVDYLVVSSKCIFNPRQWFQAFHPKTIIIDGSLPRYKALQWKEQLTRAGANVHWVQEDGAWIYPRRE